MSTVGTGEKPGTKPPIDALRDWVIKRGVLYVLTQTPMIAVLIGYFYRWTTYPIITGFTVIPAFVILPGWIAYRRRVSDDPDEPAHHFGKYLLWALLPYVVYNLARIPAHYLMNIVFWDHWYDYGFELTGKPVDQWSSLPIGTLIHSLQGYVLALGFFVLFKRVTLLNSLAYVWVLLSLIYTWHFPRYVLVDFSPPPKWYFLAWWAHFWMALAAYYTPRLYGIKKYMKTPLIAGLTAIVAFVVYFAPVGFVFWRVADWQFPTQRTIDQTGFDRVQLAFAGGPALTEVASGSPKEARYRFVLRFGPRPYKDYIKAVKSIDAGPVRIRGTLSQDGDGLAFCFAHVEQIETPNNIISPPLYFPAVTRMQYTDIPVGCVGPASAVEKVQAGGLDLDWTARMTLIGDREREERTSRGTETGLSLKSADEPLTTPAAVKEIKPGPHTTTTEAVVIGLGILIMIGIILALRPSLNKPTAT